MAEDKTKETKNKNEIKLRVEKVYEDAPLPTKPTTETDAGYDVVAHNVSRIYAHFGTNGEKLLEGEAMEPKFVDPGVFKLESGERCLIGTGLKMTVGPGYEIQVRPRSGLALKQGLTIVNTPGTIDEAYRNEVGIILMNTSRQTQNITLGDRIAQIVPKKVELLEIVEEPLSNETERGTGGFGSSNDSIEARELRASRRKFEDASPRTMIPGLTNKSTPFNFM